MSRFRLWLVVQAFLFFIPVNIYVIGDWLGAGVQWILLRYQQTYLGNSIIPVTRDITHLLNGTIRGRSAIALALWDSGAFLFIAAMILVILAYTRKDSRLVTKASIVTITGGILLTLSDGVQYGIWFNSPAGFVIPVGIPLILIIGGWMYRTSSEPDESNGTREETAL